MAVHWFPEMDEALRKGIDRNVPFHRIAEKVGVAQKTARDRAAVLNLPTSTCITHWTDEEVARMLELSAQGLTAREIGKELGRSVAAVWRKFGRMKKAGQL